MAQNNVEIAVPGLTAREIEEGHAWGVRDQPTGRLDRVVKGGGKSVGPDLASIGKHLLTDMEQGDIGYG